jgi:hypothetical protein
MGQADHKRFISKKGCSPNNSSCEDYDITDFCKQVFMMYDEESYMAELL